MRSRAASRSQRRPAPRNAAFCARLAVVDDGARERRIEATTDVASLAPGEHEAVITGLTDRSHARSIVRLTVTPASLDVEDTPAPQKRATTRSRVQGAHR